MAIAGGSTEETARIQARFRRGGMAEWSMAGGLENLIGRFPEFAIFRLNPSRPYDQNTTGHDPIIEAAHRRRGPARARDAPLSNATLLTSNPPGLRIGEFLG
jgi:hypothetical protein